MVERAAPSFAEALIALGGNVGDVRSTFDRAIAMLCDGDKVRLLARSSDYRTPPWGVTDQPPFINAVIAVVTALPPRELLARALDVERASGGIARTNAAGDRARSTSTLSPTATSYSMPLT